MTFLPHKFLWDHVATTAADKDNMVQDKWQDSFSHVLVRYFHPKGEGPKNITCCSPSLCEAWEEGLIIRLVTHALGANFCSNALLISAHFLINGGVITGLGLMGQTHWRLPPLCQISPADISFIFPGCWMQTKRSTHRDRDEAPGTKLLPREFCFHDCAKNQTLNILRSSKWCFTYIHGIFCFSAAWQAKVFPLQDYSSEVVWGDLFCYNRLCSSSSLSEKQIFTTWVGSVHISLATGSEPNLDIVLTVSVI